MYKPDMLKLENGVRFDSNDMTVVALINEQGETVVSAYDKTNRVEIGVATLKLPETINGFAIIYGDFTYRGKFYKSVMFHDEFEYREFFSQTGVVENYVQHVLNYFEEDEDNVEVAVSTAKTPKGLKVTIQNVGENKEVLTERIFTLVE